MNEGEKLYEGNETCRNNHPYIYLVVTRFIQVYNRTWLHNGFYIYACRALVAAGDAEGTACVRQLDHA
jgi:hypothetical protein